MASPDIKPAPDNDGWLLAIDSATTAEQTIDPQVVVDPKFRITDIPTVMKDTLNWPKSAELMQLWFSLPARTMSTDEKIGKVKPSEVPSQYVNTTMFTWDWLEQFDCVTAYQEHLINTLSSKAAKEEVLKRYREHFTGKEILPQKIENNLSALQLHSEWQFQRIKVPYDTDDVLTWIATRPLKIFSYKGLLDMSSMANDLYGSLGNFGLYAAITKATVKKSKKQ